MKINSDSVILVRFVNGIGIDKFANGYLIDGTPVKRKVYNGRLCYVNGERRIGFKTLKDSHTVNIVIDNDCPF